MIDLRNKAKQYEPPQFPNVVDLDKVDLSHETIDKEEDFEGKTIVKTYVTVAGVDYYVPKPVLKQIKALMEKMATLNEVSVSKSGEGKNTNYVVVPIVE